MIRLDFYLAGALALAASIPCALAQRSAIRVARPIDETQAVTLVGNVYPLARPEFDRGTLSDATRLDRMMLELKPPPSRQAALDALVAAQHDPASPSFHKWLTPAEYGARFGAASQDVARVTAWLQGHGFTVEAIPASRRLVVFSGTAAHIFDAFHTELHRYRVGGVLHVANAQDPQIPEALAGVVVGVVSLHDFRHTSEISVRRALQPRKGTAAHPLYTAGGTHYLFPADLAAIYDLNPLYSTGTTGAGASIAIAGRSNINLSDVAAFRSTSGLAANNPSVILTGANPGLVTGDQDESTLDVEWAGAAAPAAAVKLVVAASTATSDGVDLASQYIVNHALAPVVSVSYGSCERDMGATELAFYNSLWEQAASQGISVFVASGDAGAAGCSQGSDITGSGTAVNGLCTSPYATCVGGTEFNEGSNPAQYWSAANSANYGSAQGYIPEEVWNESASNGGVGLWASSGGTSLVYPQPAWQAEVSGASAANGMRAVPDVAMAAAGHDGYFQYENGSFWIVSGTSAAAPAFAGVMALVVESQGGEGQGNANAGLYPLVSAERNPFHPTPSGNNSVPGVPGFFASGADYNLATGLGSVDGAALVSSWSAGSGSGSGANFALTASPGGATVQAGQTVTFSVGVTASASAADAVTLTAAAPTGVTVVVQPAAIAPGAAASVTVTVDSGAAAGAWSIALTGSNASGARTLNYALTVMPPPALALAVAPGSVMVAGGSSSALILTAVTAGPFSGEIQFSVSGLPAGVTARWSSNPTVQASGVSTNAVALILTAASRAPAWLGNIAVTAAGGGLVSSQSVPVQVEPRLGCSDLVHSLRSRCSVPVRAPIPLARSR